MIRKALRDLWRQPVLGTVSIIGTALSIYLIMMVVMMEQVKVEPYAPESNRDRFLHSTFLSIKNPNGFNNGCIGIGMVKRYFYPMTTPEAVTAYSLSAGPGTASVPGHRAISTKVRDVDAAYWRVFDFRFLEGAPLSEAEVESSLPVAVISASVARRLFGSTEGVVGREFQLNYRTVRVAGVVEDVPSLATKAYSEIWIPLNINPYEQDNLIGWLSVTILARDRADFPAIRQEYAQQMQQVHTDNPDWEVVLNERPYDQYTETCDELYANTVPDTKRARLTSLLKYLVLLLVPAVNLTEMTRSRMRRNYAEIGVRRAFGCTRGAVIRSVLAENLIITLLAGAIGLALCYATSFMFGSSIFILSDWHTLGVTTFNPATLVHFSTFVQAALFCFVLNLLSSGIPAIRASRINIVNALSGHIRK